MKTLFRWKKGASLSSLLFFLCLTFASSAEYARADAWGANMAAAIMKQTMETIQRQIEGTLLGTLKISATQMLNNQIGQLIGGQTGGEALIITNFEEFLFRTPEQKTEVYMNDFFTLLFGSKGSSANYVGVGDTGGASGNYVNYLKTQAKLATTEKEKAPVRYDLDQYCANPSVIFETGNFRCLDALLGNPANNPFGAVMIAEAEYTKKLEEEKKEQEVIATSSGFKPATDKEGNVVTPSGTIQDVTSGIKLLPQQILANASNPAELLGSVVSGFVSKTITGLVEQGIGNVQRNIQREIGNVTNQINREIGNVTGQLGPAAPIIDQALRQRTNVNVNVNTPAPSSSCINGFAGSTC